MFSDLWIRARALFRRKSVETELDDELRFHLERQVEKYVLSGLSREEAQRRARVEFGGYEQVKEEYRDARGVSPIETATRDIRYGLRALRSNPGFSIVAILTLALGIGANTAIFSVIDSVLLRPLPYGDPDKLVMLWENSPSRNPHNTVSPPDFLDWGQRNAVFSGIAGLFDQRANLTGNGQPQEVVLQDVTANFFSILGVNPILGRGFTAENDQPGHDNVLILSYGFWKERYGGESSIIGKTITLNGHPLIVAGVAPEGFDWFIKDSSLTGAKPQMWTPWIIPTSFHDRKNVGRFMTVVARLKPSATVQQARVQMNTIAAQIAQEYPDFNGNWGANAVPVREQISGDLRPALWILFGAVGFVLLIACANVSSLLLARAAAREREMAIRTAIGASRWRIAFQLLTESVLLAVIGGGIGVALAVWGTNALLAATPRNLLDLRSVSVDTRILAFAVGSTLLAGLIFGFLPSFISAHSSVTETLKEGGRSSSAGKGRGRARSAFVVLQMCLALVLLAGSGLLIRSFIRLVGVDPGFDASHLLTFKVTLPGLKYGTDAKCQAFFQELLPRLSHLPGVRSVTMNSFPPFTGLGAATGVRLLSQPPRSLKDLPDAEVRVVGPNYFSTMGIPLRAGRTFSEDELAQARHVVIINQAFADKYLSDVNPLGQKAVIFMKSLEESGNTPSEIIGVAGDVRQMGLDTPSEPTVYWPHPELVYSGMTILVRTSNDPLALVSAVRNELQQVDPEQPMAAVATMEQLLGDSLARSRFTMLLLGIFAALALALAAVGIYGVIAYGVTQRTQEFGIRIALGAEGSDVLRLVLGQGTRLVLLGIGLGVVLALMLGRFLAALLYGISPTDPLTFGAVAVLLALVALAACYLPARRATRVDPIETLRYE
ncbi:MAG TPA: ABC transporter permease [Candidatus Acidoferrum sp.]|nr:ABC transporter permease [Candidatus Acidoferrum sp.]